MNNLTFTITHSSSSAFIKNSCVRFLISTLRLAFQSPIEKSTWILSSMAPIIYLIFKGVSSQQELMAPCISPNNCRIQFLVYTSATSKSELSNTKEQLRTCIWRRPIRKIEKGSTGSYFNSLKASFALRSNFKVYFGCIAFQEIEV